MSIIYKPLQFYIDKLKKDEKFSFARYGDGELYCMWGKQGRNSNKCDYTPELRTALNDSLKHKDDPSFIYGLQRVLPTDMEKAFVLYPEVNWHDSEFLSEAVAKGELYPFIEVLRSKQPSVTVIGNSSIRDFIRRLIPEAIFIEVPPFNAYKNRIEVIQKILIQSMSGHSHTYLFSCGMAADAFIAELHGKVDGWLIDVGHIWDPFTGNMSRCDLEGKTLEDINKNLHAPTN